MQLKICSHFEIHAFCMFQHYLVYIMYSTVQYMELYNTYKEDIEKWSEEMKLECQYVMRATDEMTLQGISQEKAFKICTIS